MGNSERGKEVVEGRKRHEKFLDITSIILLLWFKSF